MKYCQIASSPRTYSDFDANSTWQLSIYEILEIAYFAEIIVTNSTNHRIISKFRQIICDRSGKGDGVQADGLKCHAKGRNGSRRGTIFFESY